MALWWCLDKYALKDTDEVIRGILTLSPHIVIYFVAADGWGMPIHPGWLAESQYSSGWVKLSSSGCGDM